MTTGIICVILLVIVLFSVKSYLKKLRSGCCGGGDEPQKKMRADRNSAHYPYHKIVTIEGMTCSHCAQRIENVLDAQEGVIAKVNLKKHHADVYSKTPFEDGELRRIIAQAGYMPKEIQTVSA